MSVSNLNSSSRTNWERLDAMTDADIDTSDSPPLTEEFFSRATWRMPEVGRETMPEPELLNIANFVSDPDALYETLVSEVAWEEHIKARKTASFGEAYNYSRITYAVKPMHPLLVPVVDKLEQTLGFRPNNCLLNYYESGDSSMGYHSDSTEELMPGTGVAIVSLGAERSITFRSIANLEEKYHYLLPSGSLLSMSQQVQHEWKHAILKQAAADGRISLTFRSLKPSETQ